MSGVVSHPLSWYVDKLERHEPFTSLLYGDGEFMVAAGEQTGQRFTPFNEYVTAQLADEMARSFRIEGDDIVRGTDPFVLAPETYHGRDVGFFDDLHRKLLNLTGSLDGWVDGVVWDRAAREGELGPLLKALRRRNTVLIANQKVVSAVRAHLHPLDYFYVPERNAAQLILENAAGIVRAFQGVAEPVFLLCCGLAAVPLALRLRATLPGTTVLDLGGTFDVFAGIGAQRGWRAELYADPETHKALIAKHLEGLD